MEKFLYLMCGPAGSGKSTWVKKTVSESIGNPIVISRDEIRFSKIKNITGYFDKESEVLIDYIKNIQKAINDDIHDCIFADATHLTERSRNNILDKLDLKDTKIIPVYMRTSLEKSLKFNNNRTGLAQVPDTAIRRMYKQYRIPTFKEKYEYYAIVEVKENGTESIRMVHQ